MSGTMLVFGARDLSYSRKVRKFERGFTRHERRKKFEREGRICCFCGLVADSAEACTAHEQSVFHVEDRVEAARIRKNSGIEALMEEMREIVSMVPVTSGASA